MESRPQRPARQSHMVGTADSTAPAPSFHQLLAQQLHPCWLYRLRGGDECRVVFPSGATRDEVLAHVEQRFGQPVLYLKPAGVGS